MSDCLFCKIVEGDVPAKKVFEDEEFVAFRDINPQAPTHVLVIPKGPYASLDDFTESATDSEIAGFFRAVGRVARQLDLVEPGYRTLTNHGADAQGNHIFSASIHLTETRISRVWRGACVRRSR